MGRRELLLMFLVGCNSDFVDEPEEGRYSLADPPDAKAPPGPPVPISDATTEADANPVMDAAVDAKVDAGPCVRDESRDEQCATDSGADAAVRYAIACPADDDGNPVLPPPAIGCNYTGWADAGSLTMCCK